MRCNVWLLNCTGFPIVFHTFPLKMKSTKHTNETKLQYQIKCNATNSLNNSLIFTLLFFFFLFWPAVSCDLGYAFYSQYLTVIELSKAPPVSYIAHLTGALAGLTIGLLVLKNFEHRSYENLIWWMALGVYSAFTIFAIVFNLINTVTAQLMEEQGEVITQHLLHDLGVS